MNLWRRWVAYTDRPVDPLPLALVRILAPADGTVPVVLKVLAALLPDQWGHILPALEEEQQEER